MYNKNIKILHAIYFQDIYGIYRYYNENSGMKLAGKFKKPILEVDYLFKIVLFDLLRNY